MSRNHNSLQVTIMANDNAYGRIGFANSSLAKRVIEQPNHESAIHLDIVREFGSNRDLRIQYEVMGATANEIHPLKGVLMMRSGERHQTFIVYLQADNVPEVTEIFEVRYLCVLLFVVCLLR